MICIAKKDSEYVMGIKQDVDWNVARMVEKPIPETNQIFRKEELVHIHLFCENDAEHEEIPADFSRWRLQILLHRIRMKLVYL